MKLICKTIITLLLPAFFLASCTKEKTNTVQTSPLPVAQSDELKDASLQNTLVAWYTFNGNTLDSSGNNNNVIFNNATPVADRFGNANGAYSFNGTSNYMRVANSASLSPIGKITLFAIVEVNGFYSGECHSNRILNKSYDDNSPGGYSLSFDDAYSYNYNHCFSRVRTNYENFNANYGNGQSNSTGGVDTAGYINRNQWYDITFTYDGNTANLYVNGDLKYTRIGAVPYTPNNFDLFFGTTSIDNTKFPYWFNGVIDEIRIYNKAFTQHQVRKLHQYRITP